MYAEKKRLEMEQNSGKTDAPILVELFTTKDCTACIFADRILYEAMKDKQVIALSCQIKDLSEIKNADEKEAMGEESNYKGPMDPCVFRHWAYMSSRTDQDVTLNIPTFIFSGYDRLGSNNMSYFQTMLNAHHYRSKNKVLEVYMQWKDDDTITIHLPQDPQVEKWNINSSVWLIRYKDMAVERIDEGVNKGRVLRFSNIIQDIRHIAKWHGVVRTINVDVPKPQGGKERGGYVVVVSSMLGEPTMAAGKIEDYPTPNDLKKNKNQSPERAETPQVEEPKIPQATPLSAPSIQAE